MRVLVLCYANRWRSPLAAAMLVKLGGFEVRSAGFARAGRSAGGAVQEAAAKRGLSLSDHYSTKLTPDLYRWADYVLVAGGSRMLSKFVAEAAVSYCRTVHLGRYLDPPMANLPDLAFIPRGPSFDRAVDMIEQSVQAFAAHHKGCL